MRPPPLDRASQTLATESAAAVSNGTDDRSAVPIQAGDRAKRLRRRGRRYWSAFAATVAVLAVLLALAMYSPGQDHIGAIPLHGDVSWYHNYEIGQGIPDYDVFLGGIGHSIDHARRADIIFLGTSKLLFGIDWRLFEEFEHRHHVTMFNMGFAGIPSIEFSLRLIRKWNLHPKLWVIHSDVYNDDPRTSFFAVNWSNLDVYGRRDDASNFVDLDRVKAFKTVVGRNLLWRLEMPFGALKQDPYRSVVTGNWYLDNWPTALAKNNPPIVMRVAPRCPAAPRELANAHRVVGTLGGSSVLIQVPSAFSCAQRLRDLASSLGVPSFSVDPTQFSTTDGGGHLDRISSRKYSTEFFSWLEQLPEFQQLKQR